MTVVVVDEDRFVGSGFGRSRLTINRDAKAGPGARPEEHSVGWLVEEKVRRRMKPHDAFTERGEVRRVWALPEIVALAVLGSRPSSPCSSADRQIPAAAAMSARSAASLAVATSRAPSTPSTTGTTTSR